MPDSNLTMLSLTKDKSNSYVDVNEIKDYEIDDGNRVSTIFVEATSKIVRRQPTAPAENSLIDDD